MQRGLSGYVDRSSELRCLRYSVRVGASLFERFLHAELRFGANELFWGMQGYGDG